MGSFLYVVKIFAQTVVIVLLMQIQWSGSTVEQKTLQFIRTSSVVQPIQNFAESVTIVTGKWIDKAKSMFNTKLFDTTSRAEKSSSFFKLDRSEEYKEYVVNKAKESGEFVKEKTNQGKEFSKKRMQKFVDELTLNSNADEAAEKQSASADAQNNSAEE